MKKKFFRIWLLVSMIILTFGFSGYSSELEKDESKKESGFGHFIREVLNMRNSLQMGYEYDDNVDKVFDYVGKNDDHLFRGLLDSKIKYYFTKRNYLALNYQIGGKLYIETAKEDTLINNLFFDYGLEPKNDWYFNILGNIKTKLEKEAISAEGNENYLLTGTNIIFGRNFPKIINVSINPQYTFFHFTSNRGFSFHRTRYGITLRRNIFWLFSTEASYYFQQQWFLEPIDNNPERRDWLNEVSGYLIVDGANVIIKGGYIFQDSNSNITGLDFKNHKGALQFSTVFWEDLTFMFLGTLQFKKYLADFSDSITEEGERLLLTESEEENFHSIITKISKRLFGDLYLEFRFSLFSNWWSDEQRYSKYLYYTGLRYVF